MRSSDFNPRSPQGERPNLCVAPVLISYFNPRSPQGERHPSRIILVCLLVYFNPRSPQGERRKRRFLTRQKPVFQSTLPAGGATLLPGSGWEVEAISIHAPRRGSDKRESAYILKDVGFQSTLPAGGATYAVAPSDEPDGDFNPRSPQGERRWRWLLNSQFRSISIHAPRRGSDPGAIATGYGQKFQSTLPAGGATPHAASSKTFFLFQSTLPAGGATINPIFIYDLIPISIHAPRRGSDV